MVVNDENVEGTEVEPEAEVGAAAELEKDTLYISGHIQVGIRIIQDSDIEENA